MHQNAGFCINNIQKKSGGRDPRTLAAEGETFVRPHSRAHLPDAGAPPLLLGWLWPWLGMLSSCCGPVVVADIVAPIENRSMITMDDSINY